MSYLKKGLWGVAFVFAASIIANFVGYITRAVLARNISVESFGLFYAIYSFIMILLLFVNLGYGNAMVKFVSEFSAKKERKGLSFLTGFSSTVRLGFALLYGVILFFAAPWLASHYFRSESAVPVLIVFSMILFVFTIDKIFGNILNGFQLMGRFAWYRFAEKAFFLLFVIVFLYWGIGQEALLPAYALLASFIGLAFFSLILLKPLLKRFSFPQKFNKPLSKRMTGFALSSVLISLGTMIIGYIDTLILTFYRPLEEVGVYNAVLPTVIMLAFVGKSIFNVFFPMVAELWHKGLKEKLNAGIRLIHRYSMLLIMPLLLVFLVFPELILGVLFGPDYVSGALAMQILSLGIIFVTIGTIDQSTISGIGKPKEVTTVIFIAALFNIIANMALIPTFGINGAAVTTTLSYLLVMVLLSYKMRKLVGVTVDLVVMLKTFLAGAFFVVVVTVLKQALMLPPILEAGVCLLAGGFVYVATCYLLRLFSVKEVKKILKGVFSQSF